MQKQLSGQFTALALVIYPFDFTFGTAERTCREAICSLSVLSQVRESELFSGRTYAVDVILCRGGR